MWAAPEIAVITALGPVHLERMGSLERIAEAKAGNPGKGSGRHPERRLPVVGGAGAKRQKKRARSVWRCSLQHARGRRVGGTRSTGSCASGHRISRRNGHARRRGARGRARECGLRGGGRPFSRGPSRNSGLPSGRPSRSSSSARRPAVVERCKRNRRHLQRQPRRRESGPRSSRYKSGGRMGKKWW